MRSKKLCYGVLLVLSIMFGLSLSVSLNVNAYQYDVDSIPLFAPYGSTYGTNPNGFYLVVSDNYDTDTLYKNLIVNAKSLPVDGHCVASTSSLGDKWFWSPLISSSNGLMTINYSFNALPETCQTYNAMESPDSTSFVNLVSGSPILSDLVNSNLPYRFKTNSFFRTDIASDDGLNRRTRFDLHNVFGRNGYPDLIKELHIPLGYPKSSVRQDLTSNTPVSVQGEFIVDWDDPSTSFGFSNSTIGNLEIWYNTNEENTAPFSEVFPCSLTYRNEYPDGSAVPTIVIDYVCDGSIYDLSQLSYTPNIYFALSFDFEYSSSNTKLFQFIYDASIVITNNDRTPAGTFSDAPQGGDTRNAPGSAYYNDYSEPDYDSSLTNMFNFSFTNPFAAIFALFSSSESCASIPTLASMLHSNESVICPWFDTRTRAILTPVLGLASMMLLFGFAVRWLGSNSGNMFIDDDVKDTGHSFSLRNKFRRYK